MLPRSLQAQLEEADRIVAQLEGTAQPDTPTPAEPTEPAPQPQPQPVQVQQPPAPPAEQPEETWKHKYQTLNGIFLAEKARLGEAVAQHEARSQTLLQQVAELRAELEAVRSQPKRAGKRITDADRETFGAELVDLIERAQEPSVDAAEVARLNRRIEQLEGQLGHVAQTQQESAEEAFWRVLGEKVPNWAEINEMAEWKHWLLEVDDTFGVARQAGLDAAFKKRDAIRVAAIFKKFSDTLPPPALTPQQELQRQVTPSRSRGSAETPQGQTKGLIWTEETINAFLRDKRAGRLTPEQAAAYDEDLDRAAMEGRIR